MKPFKKVLLSALLATAAPMSVMAAAVQVYVGYADGLRSGADFPNPFSVGGTFGPYTVSNFLGNSAGLDSGALMLINTGASSINVTNLVVKANGSIYQIWTGAGSNQLGSGISLGSNKAIIFTENSGNNFDSSEANTGAASAGASQTATTFDASTNNCSIGAIASSTACTTTVPIVTFTLDGVASAFNDTGHVLDTGGFDSASFNHIHTGGSGVPIFNTNESLNWRLIGTTGIGDPGGGLDGNPVPEPMTLGLVAAGLACLRFSRRRA